MVDSSARLVEPAESKTETVEQAVPFRFTVTWTSVFDAFETPKNAAAVVAPMNDRVREVITVPTEPSLEPLQDSSKGRTSGDERGLQGQKTISPNRSVQWEMVVPKMVRSAPKSIRARELSAPSNHSRPALHQLPECAESSSWEDHSLQTPAIAIPNFCSLSPSFIYRVRQGSLAIKLLVVATALAGLGVSTWRHFDSTPPAAAEIQTTTRSGGWTRERVTRMDVGFNRARELVVYRPSLKATDCRFEFNWRVDAAGVGWVFRAKDTANYYAMRIKVLKPGPSPTLSVEHFAVYRGIESIRAEKVLVLSKGDPILRIRMDIAGPSFTLFIGGIAVEYWTDARLSAGGLGFFEEWHQGSDVQGVRMSFAPGTEIQRDGLRLFVNAPASGGD